MQRDVAVDRPDRGDLGVEQDEVVWTDDGAQKLVNVDIGVRHGD